MLFVLHFYQHGYILTVYHIMTYISPNRSFFQSFPKYKPIRPPNFTEILISSKKSIIRSKNILIRSLKLKSPINFSILSGKLTLPFPHRYFRILCQKTQFLTISISRALFEPRSKLVRTSFEKIRRFSNVVRRTFEQHSNRTFKNELKNNQM